MNKILKTSICFILIFLLGNISVLLGQNEKSSLRGIVRSDSTELENVHIINLSSGIGTISNENGEFRIPIQLNDTIAVSSIQYHTIGLVVNDLILNDPYIELVLIPKIIELTEIELKGHELKGVIYLDSKQLSDSLSVIAARALDFSDLGLSDPQRANYVVPKANLLNLVELIKTNKALSREEKAQYQKAIEQAPEQIAKDLGSSFFNDELGIPQSYVEDFILSCESNNIIELQLEGRKIEVIDILIREAPNYRRKNQLE